MFLYVIAYISRLLTTYWVVTFQQWLNSVCGWLVKVYWWFWWKHWRWLVKHGVNKGAVPGDCSIGESEEENGVLLRELLNEANALTASCSDSLNSLYRVECSPVVSIELLVFIKPWSGSSGNHCFSLCLNFMDGFNETKDDEVVSSTGDFKYREQ